MKSYSYFLSLLTLASSLYGDPLSITEAAEDFKTKVESL